MKKNTLFDLILVYSSLAKCADSRTEWKWYHPSMRNAKVGINCLEMKHSVDVSQNRKKKTWLKSWKASKTQFRTINVQLCEWSESEESLSLYLQNKNVSILLHTLTDDDGPIPFQCIHEHWLKSIVNFKNVAEFQWNSNCPGPRTTPHPLPPIKNANRTTSKCLRRRINKEIVSRVKPNQNQTKINSSKQIQAKSTKYKKENTHLTQRKLHSIVTEFLMNAEHWTAEHRILFMVNDLSSLKYFCLCVRLFSIHFSFLCWLHHRQSYSSEENLKSQVQNTCVCVCSCVYAG